MPVEPQKPKSKQKKAEPTPFGRALRLLARREHTRRELRAKLAAYVADPAELDALLDDLSARGWLNEARVVEQVLSSKRARFGAARIRHALIGRGVPDELIDPALRTLRETELEAARAVWSRKFRAPAISREDRARQVRFLQSRGFGMEIAMRVVRGTEDA